MTSRLRVGLVGTGRIGIDSHVPAIRAAGGEVVALADHVPGRARRFAGELGISHAFDDYTPLVRLDDVDVVAVCTPPSTHAEIAIAAFEAGKHVFLEKPPAMNEAEMTAIADASARARKLLWVGTHHICRENVQELKRRIEEGDLGSVYAVECLKLLRRGLPKGWQREKKVAGGGVAMNSSAHRLDLALYLLGEPNPISVTASTYSHFSSGPPPDSPGYVLRDMEEGTWDETASADVEDSLFALIQFDTGCTLILRDIAAAHMDEGTDPMRYFGDMRLYGTKAGARLQPLKIYSDGADGESAEESPEVNNDLFAGHSPVYRHFLDCIREGRPPLSTPNRAILTMRLIDAIYRSAETHREVRWD